MRLPNGENAFVDLRKLTEYCLDIDNPRGSHKARVFAAALGITAKDAPELREKLLEVADTTGSAIAGETDIYGQRYTVDFELTTNVGLAPVRSGWIILHSESIP